MLVKINIILCLVVFINPSLLLAQVPAESSIRTNSIQLSSIGYDQFFTPLSIGYEKIIFQKRTLAGAFKLGGTYYNFARKKQAAITSEFNLFTNSGRSHFECGLFFMNQNGRKRLVTQNGSSYQELPPWYIALQSAYRYQAPGGKLVIRVGGQIPIIMTELISPEKKSVRIRPTIEPWLNISVGRSF